MLLDRTFLYNSVCRRHRLKYPVSSAHAVVEVQNTVSGPDLSLWSKLDWISISRIAVQLSTMRYDVFLD